MDHHSLMRKAWVNACHVTLVFQIPCEDQCVVYLPTFTTQNQLNVGNLSYSDHIAMRCVHMYREAWTLPFHCSILSWFECIPFKPLMSGWMGFVLLEMSFWSVFLVQGQKFNEQNMTLKKQKSLKNSDIVFYSIQGGPKKPRYKWSYEASISRVK